MIACAACGVSFEPPPRPKGGRPSDKCEDCRRKDGGKPHSEAAKKATKQRAKAQARRKKAALSAEEAAVHEDEVARLASALGVLSEPSSAAAYAGLRVDPRDLAELVREARAKHSDLSAGDPKLLIPRLVSALGRVAHEFHSKAGLIPPGQLGHQMKALAGAIETLNEMKPPETAPGAVVLELLDSSGNPRRLVETQPPAANGDKT